MFYTLAEHILLVLGAGVETQEEFTFPCFILPTHILEQEHAKQDTSYFSHFVQSSNFINVDHFGWFP